MATLEFGHQMHCLNVIRKHTYLEYYDFEKNWLEKDPEFYRIHLDHCIEMLRQLIMCTGDVGLITFDWVEGRDIPYPDFNTVHKCRDFDSLLEWNHDNVVHLPMSHVVRTGSEIDLTEVP